jgi:formate hydrogenlyase transcriptional activator
MRSNALPSSGSGAVLGLNRALESNERRLIEKALKECNGRVFGPLGAATRLGIPSSTLESKIRRHGINKHLYRPLV